MCTFVQYFYGRGDNFYWRRRSVTHIGANKRRPIVLRIKKREREKKKMEFFFFFLENKTHTKIKLNFFVAIARTIVSFSCPSSYNNALLSADHCFERIPAMYVRACMRMRALDFYRQTRFHAIVVIATTKVLDGVTYAITYGQFRSKGRDISFSF